MSVRGLIGLGRFEPGVRAARGHDVARPCADWAGSDKAAFRVCHVSTVKSSIRDTGRRWEDIPLPFPSGAPSAAESMSPCSSRFAMVNTMSKNTTASARRPIVHEHGDAVDRAHGGKPIVPQNGMIGSIS